MLIRISQRGHHVNTHNVNRRWGKVKLTSISTTFHSNLSLLSTYNDPVLELKYLFVHPTWIHGILADTISEIRPRTRSPTRS